MTEEEARDWIADRYPLAVGRLERLVALVTEENERQNLISPSTVASIWNRHVVDSMQLLPLAGDRTGTWADIGTGGGFPGLAIATAWPGSMLLIEPRKKRANFLFEVVAALGLPNVVVHTCKAEAVRARADLVSARAVATVQELVHLGRTVASEEARWLLPRGHISVEEQQALGRRGMVFHVEQSITSEGSEILVLDRVGRR